MKATCETCGGKIPFTQRTAPYSPISDPSAAGQAGTIYYVRCRHCGRPQAVVVKYPPKKSPPDGGEG